MKYIKEYRNSVKELKYKAGDYVLVPKFDYPYNYCYIQSTDHTDMPYFIFWSLFHEDSFTVWVKEEEIERLLTPEEIEEYKNMKGTDKYNI